MLMDTIALYLKTLQKEGRAAADKAVAGQPELIRTELSKSFNDKGKLIKANGSPVTLMDILGLGIKSPIG